MKPLLILLLVLLIAAPALAQDDDGPTPTPSATPLQVPFQELNQALATANSGVNQAPADLSAPGGVPLLPSADGRQIFGYVKWLISAQAAEDVFGPFAPIFIHLGIYLGMVFPLIGVYLTILIVSYIAGWIVFIYRLLTSSVLALIVGGLVAGVATAAAGVITLVNVPGQLVTKFINSAKFALKVMVEVFKRIAP